LHPFLPRKGGGGKEGGGVRLGEGGKRAKEWTGGGKEEEGKRAGAELRGRDVLTVLTGQRRDCCAKRGGGEANLVKKGERRRSVKSWGEEK